MDGGMELYQAIYQFYLTQIQFGFYQYGEKLPTLEETCKRFHTSLDSATPAYHRLRQEGYISITKKAGAKVTVTYGSSETERHIQAFYAERREALIDLNSCIWPLLGQAQCCALRYGALESRDVEGLLGGGPVQSPNAVWKLLGREFGILGNEMILRLTRYLYLYFYGSFWGVMDNKQLQENAFMQVETAITLCQKGEWDSLPQVLRVVHDGLSNALRRFYEERITMQLPQKGTAFHWDAYKKSSQLRYSLAMDLLTEIGQGIYPTGSYLPSAERLSAGKGVSVSTVRRAVVLLNSIGAVKSSRPLGARVLPPSQSAENCDFTQPDLRRRLLDMAESLQLFALSGRAVSEITLASLDEASLSQWIQYLHGLKSRGLCERVVFASLSLITKHAPFQALRTIYSELLRLLFWGNPLQGMLGAQGAAKPFLTTHFELLLHSLEQNCIDRFSSALEALLFHELRRIVDALLELGIREAGNLLIPDVDGFDHSSPLG